MAQYETWPSCAIIALCTRVSPWPMQATAAPPEASRISRPSLSERKLPRLPTMRGNSMRRSRDHTLVSEALTPFVVVVAGTALCSFVVVGSLEMVIV